MATASRTTLAARNNEALVEKYRQQLSAWPHSWEIDPRDQAIGQAIVEAFMPFLISKIQQGRAKGTLNRYTRYLWVLGGELIRQVNDHEPDRQLSANALILDAISPDGGPYWHGAFDENEHDQFDSVCRMLYKFMNT